MSMTAVMWSSSPTAFGLPSSPLNPGRSSGDPSSSPGPMTTPTPGPSYSTPPPFILPPAYRRRPSQPVLPRYPRPKAPRSSSSLAASTSGPMDIFEGAVSPVQNAMWNERFTRRVKDRERRRRAREDDLQRRRSIDRSDEMEDEEEADRQAQADDEERRRAEHAHMVSYEIETGGSDPLLPEFWEEEMASTRRAAMIDTRHDDWRDDDEMMVTPRKPNVVFRDAISSPRSHHVVDEEEEWEREAAAAEQAERDAEEAEVARRVEEAYGLSVPSWSSGELDMDWDAFDAMDIE